MRRRTKMVSALAAVPVLAVAGTAGWWLWPPYVDRSLVAEATPAIDRHLENPANGVVWSSPASAERHPRWFCAETTIETRRDGDRALIGLVAGCQNYTRQGAELRIEAGMVSPLLVTVDRVRGTLIVRNVARPDQGAWFAPSLKRLFSRRGVQAYRRDDPTPSPDAEARRGFGLPSDAAVRLS